MSDQSIKRHIAKTITWRIVGTIDTIILGWWLSNEFTTGLTIGGFELFTKMLLYFVHERVWYKVRAFREATSKVRHLLKTITWRFVGTVDTVVLGWIISGNADVALKLGGIELFTKMLLYYLHERAWYKSNFGIKEQRNG